MNKSLKREDELGVLVHGGLSPDKQVSMTGKDVYIVDKRGDGISARGRRDGVDSGSHPNGMST